MAGDKERFRGEQLTFTNLNPSPSRKHAKLQNTQNKISASHNNKVNCYNAFLFNFVIILFKDLSC